MTNLNSYSIFYLAGLRHLFSWSKPLSHTDYEQLLLNAKIVEQDKRGTKVALLANGEYFKIFRRKRLLSSNNIYTYARSFCRNARRLAQLGIPTLTIIQLFKLESREYAVAYRPLAGATVLDLLKNGELTQARSHAVGKFIASLHDQGILFRSLHFGNIVVTPEENIGLIDIAAMTIYPWPLSAKKRLKNFDGFWRTAEYKAMFGADGAQALIQGYRNHCQQVDLKSRDIFLHLLN